MTHLTITPLRGANQIGGSIIEIASATTRLILDAGAELEEPSPATPPPIPDLFDRPGYDAVFVSHYHADHVGLAGRVHPGIPVYIGEKSLAVLRAEARYTGKPAPDCRTFQSGEAVHVGGITVTPILCDHSAFDAHAILLECGGETVLYTGDFRANGRKNFGAMLRRLPAKVDALICEGTALSHPGNEPHEPEEDLQARIEALLRERKGPAFVLCPGTNIDRIVTVYKAAHNTGRILLQDLYMAEITSTLGQWNEIPNPRKFPDVSVFITRGGDRLYEMLCGYGDKKIGKAAIAKLPGFVMCVRSAMGNYLQKLSEQVSFAGGTLIYSMWEGYRKQPAMADFLARCAALGLEIVTLHTSGHADKATIEKLIARTHPEKIVPVHTENPGWFAGHSAVGPCPAEEKNMK